MMIAASAPSRSRVNDSAISDAALSALVEDDGRQDAGRDKACENDERCEGAAHPAGDEHAAEQRDP